MKMIITADWHIRNTAPRCRSDKDWMQTQKNALWKLLEYAEAHDCDIFVVGDLFHSVSDTSFECVQLIQGLALALKKIGKRLYILAGNHDLLYHSEDNIERSAIGILFKSENIFPISSVEGVSAPNFGGEVDRTKKIVFTHVLTFPDRDNVPPNVNALTAYDLLDEYPEAEYIFTGDYHHSFHVEEKDRHVINPGCLLRQVADMKDYKPLCYLVDTDSGSVDTLYIGDDDNLIDDSYLIKEEAREQRIEEFVDKLKETKNVSLDFVENVRKYMDLNDFDKEFRQTVSSLIHQNYSVM